MKQLSIKDLTPKKDTLIRARVSVKEHSDFKKACKKLGIEMSVALRNQMIKFVEESKQ